MRRYEMRRFTIMLVGLGVITAAAPLHGCAGRGIATRHSVSEWRPYRSMTYSDQSDARERAKGRNPW